MNLIESFESDYSNTRSGVRMLMECRGPPTQLMTLNGSITTAYSFSNDLNNPESDLFKEYASTLELEMSSIMMRSSMMKSVDLQVTGFLEVSAAKKRRQATTTTTTTITTTITTSIATPTTVATAKAIAEFEAFVEVSEDAVMEDVQGAVENEIQLATDEGLGSLDADSFNTIGVVVATTTTTTTTSTTTTTTTTTTTSTTTTTTTTATTRTTIATTTTTLATTKIVMTKTTTTSTTELAPISTCRKGNEWLKIDQSKSLPWSWQASITIGRRANAGLFSCSGVILSSDWILTAADCCIGSIVDEMEVYTGSLDFSHGTMHKVRYYKTQNEICAIRLDDEIRIDGKTTSVGCFQDELSDDNCWMAAWQHKVMTHDRQNRLISKSVELSNYGTTGSSVCDTNSNMIDFTGSPVMCQKDSISYISGVIWEDRGILKLLK